MNTNRRSFLQLLGLAPVAVPAVAKALAEAGEALPSESERIDYTGSTDKRHIYSRPSGASGPYTLVRGGNGGAITFTAGSGGANSTTS